MSARRPLGALLAAAGIAIAIAGGSNVASQKRATEVYEELETVKITVTEADGEEPDAINWDSLLATNPDVVAWCQVEGTDIDLPVCQASDEEPEHWLTHDLWDDESPAGTPYVDHRASAESRHILCYGHHLAGTGGMFSQLYRCHEQSEFDRILTGDLLWSTPDGETAKLHPLCACVVDKDDSNIQRLSFDNDADFRTWLGDILVRSTACGADATELVATARKAITLATCASDLSGRPERTVVTFVA